MNHNVDEVVRLLSAFDPTFHARIQPASPDDVSLLEGRIGSSIPQAYREYLLKMGRNNGGLDLFCYARSDIDTLLSLYKGGSNTGLPVSPPGCIVIGIYGDVVSEIYLELEKADDGRLFYGDLRQSQGLYADSFLKVHVHCGNAAFDVCAGKHCPPH